PSDRRSRELDRSDDAPSAADRGLALDLGARSALDQLARLVAGLGSRRDPGGRQRLAPAWLGCSARLAHDLDRDRGARARSAAGWAAGRADRHLSHPGRPGAGPGGGRGWWRPALPARSWSARTARARWSAARWRASPARRAITG